MYSFDNGGLLLGVNVDIQRTDGRVHSAIISHINAHTNSITVEWFEKGEAKGKEIEIESIYQLNPNLRPKASKMGNNFDERSFKNLEQEDIRTQFLINSDAAISDNGDQCQSNSNGEIENTPAFKEIPKIQLTSAVNQSKGKGTNIRLPLNTKKSQVPNMSHLIPKSGINPSMLDMSCVSQQSFGDSKFNKKKNQMSSPKRYVRNEIDKEYLKKEERSFQQRMSRDSELLESSDPNYEFKMMILEFQKSLDNTDFSSPGKSEDNRICVCVRKRPLNTKELTKKEIDVITIPNKHVLIVHEPRLKVDLKKYLENQNFRFDFAFDDLSDNFTVYHYTAKPLVESIFERGMATCFAYGQTGSGKTHTMGGDFQSLFQQDSSKGIYGLAARDIFKLINTKYRNENLSVEAAFFEIYGGKVFDLLNKKQKLRVLEDQHGTVQVVGLREEIVASVDDVLKLIQTGMNLRTSGQTSANQHSSRSHAVLQLILKKKQTKKLHGKFSLIDLAGNERGADTSTSDRVTRMEGAEINKSLLALKECIRALGRNGSHLPFRASKLTQVLRDSFIGENIRTCMIAMISPGMSCCEHTLNTLRYADRVKELVPGKTLIKSNYDDDNYSSKGISKAGSREQQIASAENKFSKNGAKLISEDNKSFYNSIDFKEESLIPQEISIDLPMKNNTRQLLKEIHHEHNSLIETIPVWLNEHKKLYSVNKHSQDDVEVYTNHLESLILRNIGRLSTLKVKLSKWNANSNVDNDERLSPVILKKKPLLI